VIVTTQDTSNRLPLLAREAVEASLAEQTIEPPLELLATYNYPAGAFVTIRHVNGALRGCLGTHRPVCANVVAEILRVAPLAASSDPRFPAVTADELPNLTFEVSILTPPEEVLTTSDLDAERYGVLVTDEMGRRGLLLPAIQGIDTVERQLFEVRRKAGIPDKAPIKMERFEVLKFEE